MNKIIVPALLVLAGCARFRDEGEARRARAAKSTGDIVIGVVWPGDDHFWHGVDIALDRIRSEGGVMGRSFAIHRREDLDSIAKGKSVAQELAEDPDVVAVIGHRDTEVAVVTSIIYEFADLVMIAPGTSSRRLTRDGFERVFRTLPPEDDQAEQLADYAEGARLSKIMIAYENGNFGRSVANAFESRAESRGLSIAERVALEKGGISGFERSLRARKGSPVDAVLLAVPMPDATKVIAALREEGISAPVLAVEETSTSTLALDPAAEGAVIAGIFHLAMKDAETQDFRKRYEEKHGHSPDTWAAQGYDAVRLLARAIARAKSTVPAELAEALRSAEGFPGATGHIRFDERGAVRDKQIVFSRARAGKLVALER